MFQFVIQPFRTDVYVLCEVKRNNGFLPTGYRKIGEGTRQEMEKLQEGLTLDTVILPPFTKRPDGTMSCDIPSDAALFFRGYFPMQ